MKLLVRICLSLCIAVVLAAPASAGYLYPFGGWWGAGYYGTPLYAAPAYSSYYGAPSYAGYYGSTSYSSFYGGGSVVLSSNGCCGNAAPMYSASYGTYNNGCCANSCCDSCGSGCAAGSCGATEPAGSLKPAIDPISNKSKPTYEDDDRSREFPSDAERARRRQLLDDEKALEEDQNRTDLFKRSGTGSGSGTDSGTALEPFPENPDFDLNHKSEKPPMADPQDGTVIEPIDDTTGTPTDEKTFIDENKSTPADSARLRRTILARTSSLSEVIAPKRMASRSLPATHRPLSNSNVAGKSEPQPPLRWISAPLPAGHVSL
ncbi:MAG: hypothetical protein O2856_12765 [Planctomycetota bacterium]|nr:hypothetical protein [Planctomycetota bacterium]